MEDPLRLIIDAVLGIFAVTSYFLGKRDGKLERYRDRDRKLYNAILDLLPKESMIYYRDQDFGAAFTDQVFERLRKFKMECEYPQSYFLDKNLEKLRKELLASTSAFLKRLQELTVHVNNPGKPFHRLPPPHEIGNEVHGERSKELNDLANTFYNTYTKFVITAEKTLP